MTTSKERSAMREAFRLVRMLPTDEEQQAAARRLAQTCNVGMKDADFALVQSFIRKVLGRPA